MWSYMWKFFIRHSMHAHVTCHLRLLDRRSASWIPGVTQSVSSKHSSACALLTAPVSMLFALFFSPLHFPGDRVDQHLPQAVSRACLTSEVALHHRSMWQDIVLRFMSLVNWFDLPLGRRWYGPWQGLRWPSESCLVYLGHYFMEAGLLAKSTGQLAAAQTTSSWQPCSSSQTSPVSNLLSHSVTLSLMPYVKSI